MKRKKNDRMVSNYIKTDLKLYAKNSGSETAGMSASPHYYHPHNVAECRIYYIPSRNLIGQVPTKYRLTVRVVMDPAYAHPNYRQGYPYSKKL